MIRFLLIFDIDLFCSTLIRQPLWFWPASARAKTIHDVSMVWWLLWIFIMCLIFVILVDYYIAVLFPSPSATVCLPSLDFMIWISIQESCYNYALWRFHEVVSCVAWEFPREHGNSWRPADWLELSLEFPDFPAIFANTKPSLRCELYQPNSARYQNLCNPYHLISA